MTGESEPQAEKPYQLSEEGLVEVTNRLVNLKRVIDNYRDAVKTSATKDAVANAEQSVKRTEYAYELVILTLDEALPRNDRSWGRVIEELESVEKRWKAAETSEEPIQSPDEPRAGEHPYIDRTG